MLTTTSHPNGQQKIIKTLETQSVALATKAKLYLDFYTVFGKIT